MTPNTVIRLLAICVLGGSCMRLALRCPADALPHDQAFEVTEQLLRSLTYGDTIPGFRQTKVQRDIEGPWIVLRPPVSGRVQAGYIVSQWESDDGLNLVHINVQVHPSPAEARAEAQKRTSMPLTPDPPEATIGQASWSRFMHSHGGVVFIAGRVAARLGAHPINRRERGESFVSQMDGHIEEILRTLARGLEWMIRQHPEMMADTEAADRRTVVASGTPVSAPALTFGNVAWTSLDAFRQAGAEVAWDANSGKANVSYRGKTVELTALRREARVSGKNLDLGAGVMVDRFGPIVPLRKIAEALGMKVRETTTTIEIG